MVAEDLDEDGGVEPSPWSWPYLAGIGMTFVANASKAVAVAAEEVAHAVAQHCAWVGDRQQFAESVHRDIAHLPTAPD